MRLSFNVKPRIITGTSKNDILTKAGLGGWIVDNSGSRYAGYTRRGGDTTVFAVNFEKRRKKVKLLKNGNRKIVERGHWIAYVYNFTKYADFVKIKQNKRNFVLTFKK